MVRFRSGAAFGATGLLVCVVFMGLFWLVDIVPSPVGGLITMFLVLPRMVLWPASMIFLILDGSPNWGPFFWQVVAVASGLNVVMYFLVGALFGQRLINRWKGASRSTH